MIRRPPRSTRTDTLLSLHDALPICPCPFPTCRGQPLPDRLDPSLPSRHAPWPNDPCRPSSHGSSPSRQIRYGRSEEHTSELQSLMRISYAVFCLKKKKKTITHDSTMNTTKIHKHEQHPSLSI